jgi:hypothetical protein
MTVVSMSEREFSRLDVLSDLDSGRIRVGEACDVACSQLLDQVGP